MSIFKRQTSPCPPNYRRSLSEPAYVNAEIGTSLKSYPWCAPVRSKRKEGEHAVPNLGKPLGAYRWQTRPSFRWKGGKNERLQNNKGHLDEPQQRVLPKMAGNNDSSSANKVLGTSAEKMNLVNTQSLRVPFARSLSEPEPHCSISFVKSVESEQQGYFIRGIFSTLSNGFSRMLSLKGESTNEPVKEGILWWIKGRRDGSDFITIGILIVFDNKPILFAHYETNLFSTIFIKMVNTSETLFQWVINSKQWIW